MIRSIRSLGMALCAVGALAGASGAWAQATGTPVERTHCDGVQQDRAACLREIGAARQESQRNGLTSASPVAYDQNALARCQLQPAADQAACEAVSPRGRNRSLSVPAVILISEPSAISPARILSASGSCT